MTEIWYHLGGGPIDIHIIHSDGKLTTNRLGDSELQLLYPQHSALIQRLTRQ